MLADPVTQGTIAYFSMEIALETGIPTYSGGLGVLAGDTLRAAADLGLPMVGVTLLHRQGYFTQHLDADGTQREDAVAWSVTDRLEPTEGVCQVEVEGRHVTVRAWRYVVRGVAGSAVPVLFLDTDVPGNNPFDRRLADQLYGGDARYRLCEEVMRLTIALNASFFNTHRMLQEYVIHAYQEHDPTSNAP